MHPDITLVIPVYNEAEYLCRNISIIRQVCDACPYSFAFLLVDDGSQDKTRELLSEMRRIDSRVEYISFTRNFGKEAAIEAGLAHARGRACVVMDSDLQHPPSIIPQMLKEWENGFLVVDAVKRVRNDSRTRTLLSNMFYKIFESVSGINIKDRSDFKLLDRRVVDFYTRLHERHKFFRGVIAWARFKGKDILFDVEDRRGGGSKWSFVELMRYALANITAFTYIPMMALGWLGALTVAGTGAVAVITFLRWVFGEAIPGFTTVILLLTFLGGVVLLGLGIVAYYISIVVDETRDRPRYVIEASER